MHYATCTLPPYGIFCSTKIFCIVKIFYESFYLLYFSGYFSFMFSAKKYLHHTQEIIKIVYYILFFYFYTFIFTISILIALEVTFGYSTASNRDFSKCQLMGPINPFFTNLKMHPLSYVELLKPVPLNLLPCWFNNCKLIICFDICRAILPSFYFIKISTSYSCVIFLHKFYLPIF